MQLFIAAFARVPDPRAENVRHDLVEILIVAFVAVLCGAQGCSEMAEFGCAKLKFFKRFLKLRHGIPSHDTCSTVLRMLDPKAVDAAFGKLAATLAAALAKGGVIAIDGKSLKGAYDKGKKSSPRMMVSAYAAGRRLTLATVAAEERNEVDAALEVLGLIDLKGKIVTGDALHCNRRMVELIVEKGGDYCIALKGNQESLLSDARSCLAAADKPKPGKRPPPTAKTETKTHGRIETRIGVVVEAKGACQAPRVRRPQSDRPRRSDAPDRRQDQHRRAHLRAVAKALATGAAGDGPCPLADRECTALAARRLLRRGRRAQPQGQRTGQHRRAPPPRARRSPFRSEQGITDGKAETSRLG
jgi:predicted transposase YbfD/YdcC